MTRAYPSLVLAAAVLLGPAGPVFAQEDNMFDKHRTEMGFGLLAGGFAVGPIGGPAIGLHLDVARHMGPLLLLGEYNFASIGENSYENTPAIRGMLNRFGVAARYAFMELGGERIPLQGSFWLEAGAGREQINWDGGGVLRRNDLSVGFGAQANFVLGRDSDKPKYIGFYYAFRGTIAQSPDADQPGMPTCAGPCDEPTEPSPYDLGLFFNMGLTWGL